MFGYHWVRAENPFAFSTSSSKSNEVYRLEHYVSFFSRHPQVHARLDNGKDLALKIGDKLITSDDKIEARHISTTLKKRMYVETNNEALYYQGLTICELWEAERANITCAYSKGFELALKMMCERAFNYIPPI